MRNSFIDLELRFHVFSIKEDVSTFVAHGIAIVGSWKYGDALAVVRHFIAVVLHLVWSDDVIQVVPFKEVLGDIGTWRESWNDQSKTNEK